MQLPSMNCDQCKGSGNCDDCHGTGNCSDCKGSGFDFGFRFNEDDCVSCSGSGDCDSCDGSGECPGCNGEGEIDDEAEEDDEDEEISTLVNVRSIGQHQSMSIDASRSQSKKSLNRVEALQEIALNAEEQYQQDEAIEVLVEMSKKDGDDVADALKEIALKADESYQQDKAREALIRMIKKGSTKPVQTRKNLRGSRIATD